MECPNCKNDIELTWRVYFKSPFGKYTCTKCSTKFKFRRTWKYGLWVFSWALALYLGEAVILLKLKGDSDLFFWAWLLFMSVIFLPTDRAMEKNLATIPR